MAEVCTHCGGLPIAPGMSQENTEGWCPHCDGSGMASPIQEEPENNPECPHCHGESPSTDGKTECGWCTPDHVPSVVPKARWYDHWEDGASREHRGMREDDERLARQQEDLYG